MLSFVITVLLSACFGDLEIRNSEELIKFAAKVNDEGYDFSNETVFLTSDIDMSTFTANFTPIGTDGNSFRGTFDGHGHIISNLAVTSSASSYVGLFGCAYEAVFKNTVLDASCTVKAYAEDTVFVGGFVGHNSYFSVDVSLEGLVNAAAISVNNTNEYSESHVGGIAGYLTTMTMSVTISNCANSGEIAVAGYNIYVGGIVGEVYGINEAFYAENCANYGTLIWDAEFSYVGGVAGFYSDVACIENCVHAGFFNPTRPNEFIGSFIGMNSNTGNNVTVQNAFWAEWNSAYKPVCGYTYYAVIDDVTSFDDALVLGKAVKGSTDIVKVLNSHKTYTAKCHKVTFHISGGLYDGKITSVPAFTAHLTSLIATGMTASFLLILSTERHTTWQALHHSMD